MLVAEQPTRYGGRRKARTPALVMCIRTATPEDPYKRHRAACFGNKGHYHIETGICVHIETVAAGMSLWHRQRARYLPFGDREQPDAPLPERLRRKG